MGSPIADDPDHVNKNAFIVSLSRGFIATVLLCTSSFAFIVGFSVHFYWEQNLMLEEKVHCASTILSSLDRTTELNTTQRPAKRRILPEYSCKDDGSGTCPSENAFMSDGSCDPSNDQMNPASKSSAHDVQTKGFVQHENQVESGQESDNDSIPFGHQLLVDIKDVDEAFLNSESRLTQGLLSLSARTGLELLSYNCHKLTPSGVSCFAFLTRSHISFYTWPVSGVISLDLFSCAGVHESLVPLLRDIADLFGVPRRHTMTSGIVEPLGMVWAQKPRGFERHEQNFYNPQSLDLNQYLLSWMGYVWKKSIVSRETDFQAVDIFEVYNPRFRHLSFEENGESRESQNPEFFRPDRLIYLDSVMQSRLYGEAAYHEALVHPGMFVHEGPRNVAIIGGGEGATLREILKHNTVKKVTMIEIDEELVKLCREFIPEWSDCSILADSSNQSCFDDPRAEIIYEDAVRWFMERFGGDSKDEKTADNLYDVIVIDALDPNSVVDFSDIIFNSNNFTQSLFHALSDRGIVVVQTGISIDTVDPPQELMAYEQESQLIGHLKASGFQSIVSYEEAHGGFLSVWRFIVAFKDESTRSRWYANQAQVDHLVQQRSMETVPATGPLFRYFDGATMASYQTVSRVIEISFCCETTKPPMCDKGFDPNVPSVPISVFSVKPSNVSSADLGLFSKYGVAKGAYLAPEERVNRLFLSPSSTTVIEYMAQHCAGDLIVLWNMIQSFMRTNGFSTGFPGPVAHVVDTSILTFLNHGCNGTYNTGQKFSVTEQTANMDNMPADLASFGIFWSERNIAVDRNLMLFLSTATHTSLHDIGKEAEVLDNHLGYLHAGNWKSGISDYGGRCQRE